MQPFALEFCILSLLVVFKYYAVATVLDAEKLGSGVTREQTAEQVGDAGIKPQQTTEKHEFKNKLSPLEQYKKLFLEHRATQLNAVKSMRKFTNSEAQYQLINIMLSQLFNNMYDASQNLTAWGFNPGDEFPTNITIRESMSKVLENVALFGDLVLTMPQVVHEFYDKNQNWQLMLKWGYLFSLQSGIFEGPNQQLLSLMAQEAGLVPKQSNYVNPFAAKEKGEDQGSLGVSVVSKKPKEKKKKKIPRGPRMTKTEL